jgi:acyl carrier protein
MKKKPSKTEIINIISKILKMSPQQLEKIDDYTKMKNWDSLAHLDILSALDTKLNNKINKIKNIAQIMSVKKIIEILKKKSLISI